MKKAVFFILIIVAIFALNKLREQTLRQHILIVTGEYSSEAEDIFKEIIPKIKREHLDGMHEETPYQAIGLEKEPLLVEVLKGLQLAGAIKEIKWSQSLDSYHGANELPAHLVAATRQMHLILMNALINREILYQD